MQIKQQSNNTRDLSIGDAWKRWRGVTAEERRG